MQQRAANLNALIVHQSPLGPPFRFPRLSVGEVSAECSSCIPRGPLHRRTLEVVNRSGVRRGVSFWGSLPTCRPRTRNQTSLPPFRPLDYFEAPTLLRQGIANMNRLWSRGAVFPKGGPALWRFQVYKSSGPIFPPPPPHFPLPFPPPLPFAVVEPSPNIGKAVTIKWVDPPKVNPHWQNPQ